MNEIDLKNKLITSTPRIEVTQDSFADYAGFPAVNSSSIKLFDCSRDGAPRLAYDYMAGNFNGDSVVNRTEDSDEDVSEALKFGKLYHTYILEPDEFEHIAIVLDKEKQDELFDLAVKQGSKAKGFSKSLKLYKEWREFHEKEGKTVVDAFTMWQLKSMRAEMDSQVETKPILSDVFRSEVSVYFALPASNGMKLQCKARVDAWPRTSTILEDLKSVRSAAPEQFAKSVHNFGYDLQAAFYLMAAQAVGKDVTGYAFTVQEKNDPFLSARYVMPQDWLDFARREIASILTRMKVCINSGKWPGHRSGELIPPVWVQNMIDTTQ